MSAWADDVASYDFNDGTTPIVIKDAARMSASYTLQDGSDDNYYVHYKCINMNDAAFAYYNFYEEVSNAATVTVAFDFNIAKKDGHALISIADADYHTRDKGGFTVKSNSGYGANGAIFNLGCWRVNSSTGNHFAVNSGYDTDLTENCLDNWCHAVITIDNVKRTVDYSITNLDGTVEYASATGVSFLNAKARRCSQIDLYMGYYKDSENTNSIKIDNLAITKTINETSHTYSIDAVSGGAKISTLASNTAIEGYNYSTNIPKVIFNDDNKKYYVLDDASNSNLTNYSALYVMGNTNVTKEINYTLDNTILYYAEAEDMVKSGTSNGQTNNKNSKGTAYCTKELTDAYFKSALGLSNDVYADLEVGIYGRRATNPTLKLINGSAETIDMGNKSVSEGGYGVWTKEKQLIPAGYEFYIKNDYGSNNASKFALDYIIIRRSSVSATIGSTGYTTFSSAFPLALGSMTASTGEVSAYYAKAVETNYVKITKIDDNVEAGEGLILKGTVGATITIPVAASGSDIDNYLVGCPSETVLSANANYYVLVNNGGTAEFQCLDTNGATIPAGKAYLNAGSTNARLSIVFDDDETTGVQELKNSRIEGLKTGNYYNLSGQRVAMPTKGLHIVNGKKVVVK